MSLSSLSSSSLSGLTSGVLPLLLDELACLVDGHPDMAAVRPVLFQMVIGPLYHGTIPDRRVKHGRVEDGRGGGLLQPGAGDDQGGERE